MSLIPCAQTVAPQRLRLVLDTNVWLDWLVFADAGIAAIRNAVAAGNAQIFIDTACENELQRVLAYARTRTTLDRTAQAACLAECRGVSIKLLQQDCSARTINASELPICRDADDQKFLELARDCGANFLVTKDRALLELARRKVRAVPFRIVTPGQFEELIYRDGCNT